MRWLIASPGAVGGYVAAGLAAAGEQVAVLARPARAELLRAEGLRIVSPSGEERTVRPTVVTADEVGDGYHAVVLAVKAQALAEVMDDVAPAVGEATSVMPFLNGLSHLEPLRERFGGAVLGGVVRVATMIQDDGAIKQFAPVFEIDVGELDNSVTPRVNQLAAAFQKAGAKTEVPADIIGAMWTKWVFIAAISAATSLMRGTVGDIASVPGGPEFARALLDESAAVAAAAGHPIAPDVLAGVGRSLTAADSPGTASISRDVMSGRPAEVLLLSDMVDQGRTLGVPTPLLEVSAVSLAVHNRRLARGAPV